MAFSDKSGNGLTNLYSMISYCLNESQCRRKLIAKYFDEVWQSNDCNQMCDICTRSLIYTTKRNCREEALIIINYLKNHNNNKQRLTALKLIEQINIKTMIKIDLQRLILQLIIHQYLKEDFHFTPYTTICYIKLGTRAEYIKNENCQILLDIIENTKKQIIKKNSTKPAVLGRIN
jgi:ATP-dependent DNA helicase Q1